MSTTVRTVRCPACGGKSRYAPDNPFRPFCSARCREHDLGAWATEHYRIERRETPEDLDDALEPPPPPERPGRASR